MNSINDISLFAITDQKYTFGYTNVSKMHINLQGKDLGDLFSITIEKLNRSNDVLDEFEAGSSPKFNSKNWMPLKIENSNGQGEIWVKVNKTKLKRTFHISDKELNLIKNSTQLQNLIKNKITQSLKEKDDLLIVLKSLNSEVLKSSDQISSKLLEIREYGKNCEDDHIKLLITDFLKKIDKLDKNFVKIVKFPTFYNSKAEILRIDYENKLKLYLLDFISQLNSDFLDTDLFSNVQEKIKNETNNQVLIVGYKYKIVNPKNQEAIKNIFAEEFNAVDLDIFTIQELKLIKEVVVNTQTEIRRNSGALTQIEESYLKNYVENVVRSVDTKLLEVSSSSRQKSLIQPKRAILIHLKYL